MKLFCLWCATVMLARQSAAAQQDDGFYAPQTFQNHIAAYQQGLFKPAQSWTRDAEPQPQNRLANTEPWRPAQSEPWKSYSKEQQASILHHKQTLSKEGSFRYEFASDNGVAAGEVIEPDGSRLGAFQYKDPSGQLVKLKYRAGKEGFQILEGSHLPKSPEPVAYPKQGEAYQDAYTQQRQQFQLQQQHNQQPQQYSQQQYGQPRQQNSLWTQSPQTFQNYPAARPQQQSAGGAGNQYFTQNNWGAGREDQEDDGQYRENDIENQKGEERGPHNFGEGYAFEFQG